MNKEFFEQVRNLVDYYRHSNCNAAERYYVQQLLEIIKVQLKLSLCSFIPNVSTSYSDFLQIIERRQEEVKNKIDEINLETENNPLYSSDRRIDVLTSYSSYLTKLYDAVENLDFMSIFSELYETTDRNILIDACVNSIQVTETSLIKLDNNGSRVINKEDIDALVKILSEQILAKKSNRSSWYSQIEKGTSLYVKYQSFVKEIDNLKLWSPICDKYAQLFCEIFNNQDRIFGYFKNIPFVRALRRAIRNDSPDKNWTREYLKQLDQFLIYLRTKLDEKGIQKFDAIEFKKFIYSLNSDLMQEKALQEQGFRQLLADRRTSKEAKDLLINHMNACLDVCVHGLSISLNQERINAESLVQQITGTRSRINSPDIVYPEKMDYLSLNLSPIIALSFLQILSHPDLTNIHDSSLLLEIAKNMSAIGEFEKDVETILKLFRDNFSSLPEVDKLIEDAAFTGEPLSVYSSAINVRAPLSEFDVVERPDEPTILRQIGSMFYRTRTISTEDSNSVLNQVQEASENLDEIVESYRRK